MPTYTYVCRSCKTAKDLTRRVAARDESVPCSCGANCERLTVYAPMLRGGEFREYVSPATGRLISSPTQERDELSRTGCVIDEAGMAQDIKRNRARSEGESDARIEHLVSTEYAALAASNLGVE